MIKLGLNIHNIHNTTLRTECIYKFILFTLFTALALLVF